LWNENDRYVSVFGVLLCCSEWMKCSNLQQVGYNLVKTKNKEYFTYDFINFLHSSRTFENYTHTHLIRI
jgi:hypothetical protein